jgi:hypothetical protein
MFNIDEKISAMVLNIDEGAKRIGELKAHVKKSGRTQKHTVIFQ